MQEHDRPFPALKQSLVAGAIAERNVDARGVPSASFDDAAGLQAKTWVFAMIPMLALVTAALYGFRRYFFEHLIFATHLLDVRDGVDAGRDGCRLGDCRRGSRASG